VVEGSKVSLKLPASHIICAYNEALACFTANFDSAAAHQLLSEFVQAVEELLEELGDIVKMRRLSEIKPVTHRLIGLCPVFQAHQLAELAQLLDNDVQLEDWQAIELRLLACREAFRSYIGA
jgi:HPt (histidine-containing phosphotransfer) domain-containing protein